MPGVGISRTLGASFPLRAGVGTEGERGRGSTGGGGQRGRGPNRGGAGGSGGGTEGERGGDRGGAGGNGVGARGGRGGDRIASLLPILSNSVGGREKNTLVPRGSVHLS